MLMLQKVYLFKINENINIARFNSTVVIYEFKILFTEIVIEILLVQVERV